MHFSDYVEQLTYLLFLKMVDERTEAPYNQTGIVPVQWGWQTLLKKTAMSCSIITSIRWKRWVRFEQPREMRHYYNALRRGSRIQQTRAAHFKVKKQ